MGKSTNAPKPSTTGGYTVVYDSQIFDVQVFGGISRYFCEIITRLHSPFKVVVGFSRNHYLNACGLCRRLLPLPKFVKRQVWKRSARHSRRELLARLSDSGTRLVFHPTYYDPYFLNQPARHPYVLTVHDMIYERVSGLPCAEDVMKQKRETILGAERVIAISEYTKRDIMELLDVPEEKIDIVYHSTSLRPNKTAGTRMPYRYLLYVGDRSAGYKNFAGMFDAFRKLHAKDSTLHLVCTGRRFSDEERTHIAAAGVETFVHQIAASDKTLADLYQQAEAFVYPSRYEGFGIPILEAYACGCPVVLSRATCFPEIAGEAGEYFDPDNTDDIARAIGAVIYDKARRNALVTAGTERLSLFSWEKAAAQTEECYRKAAESYAAKHPEWGAK